MAVIDADLQDPPEVILRLVEKWREGYDVVNAVREKRKEGLAKRFAYALFYKVYRRLASIDVPLDSGDFAPDGPARRRRHERAAGEEPLRAGPAVVVGLPPDRRRVRARLARGGRDEVQLPQARSRLAFDGIVNFSTAPLSLIFGLGVATAVIAHVRRRPAISSRASSRSRSSATPRARRPASPRSSSPSSSSAASS